ncbi:hypothetical protein ACVOMV_16595 [Mesorhizobium atlanticum]
MDEADAFVVAAGLAAFGAAEMRGEIDRLARVVDAETATQLGHIDGTMPAAAGVAAMDAHSVSKRQHLTYVSIASG